MLFAVPGFAQEDFFRNIEVATDAAQQQTQSLNLFGWLEAKAAYGLQAPDAVFSRDESKLSRLEGSAFLQLDWQARERLALRLSARYSSDQIYHLQGQHRFHPDEINEFQDRFELRDMYLDARLTDRLYLKLGQQIIAWGMAENLRIGDQVNTLNRFSLGHEDLEDLRRQVPAARLTYTFTDWTFDSVVTYAAGSDDYPPAFDEFDPLAGLRDDDTAILTREPANQYEFILRASTNLNGSDLSLTVGDLNANNPGIGEISFIGMEPDAVTLEQDRFQVYAFAANRVFGSWLLAAEVGAHLNRALPVAEEDRVSGSAPWLQHHQILAAINIQFSGLRNWVITAEADTVYTRDYESILDLPREQHTYSLRLSRTLMNERIQLLGIWNQSLSEDSEYARLGFEYDWSDNIELGLLWVYHAASADSPLYDFRHNDILQLSLRYSFQR